MTPRIRQHENVFDDGNHARGEHIVQGIHVGSHAGHQPPHGILVEERDVHALQMAVELAAQVEHHLLSGPLHQVGLGEFKEEAQQQHAEEKAADLRDPTSGWGLRKRSRKECPPACAERYLSIAVLVR
jgi:hypothetical protein